MVTRFTTVIASSIAASTDFTTVADINSRLTDGAFTFEES